MRVLVTGHDGYIGTVLVSHLKKKGYEVSGLDSYFYEDCWLGKHLDSCPALRKDIRDVTLTDLEGIDAVVHLAALSNDPLGQLSTELTLDHNYRATENLAKLSKQAGVQRFLYASSCSLYGKSDQLSVDENTSMAPLTAYAQSKVMSEKALLALANEHFSPIILRCSTVFGYSPKLRVDLVVNNLTGWGFTLGKIKILSDGSPWRPLIHVEDLARAYEFFLAIELGKHKEKIFNIGFNSHNYQVRQIAESVAHHIKGSILEFAVEPDRDSRSYRVNFDRFESVSKLKPQWDLDKGIQHLLEVYREHGFKERDFRGRKFTRLNQIRHLSETQQLDKELRWR